MKNHYVSQLIIKRFSQSINTFNTVTKSLVENRQAHKIFFRVDIYDNDVEKKLAHDLEQPFAKLLDDKILNFDKIVLTRRELQLLKKFLLLDSVRTYSASAFVKVLTNFQHNVDRYLDLHGDILEKEVRRFPRIDQLGIGDKAIQMRAMRLYLECSNVLEMAHHPLVTQELYCWAMVNNDSYVAFWDSSEDQEFILTSTGMISEYEPSHEIFEGLDLSKFSYLLDKVKSEKKESNILFYQKLLSFNQIMYENFNIFNLSARRCLVLVHPFFRLYGDQPIINGEKVTAKKPDIWPTCFESKDIIFTPKNNYKHFFWGLSSDDEFEYTPAKLSFWDMVYLNSLILSHTTELIGFNDINKIVDSLSMFTLISSLSDKKLYNEKDGLKVFGWWIDNMLNDRYSYIFKHYNARQLECTCNPFDLIDKFGELKWKDICKNKYLLQYLLSDEDKLRTMSNFAFLRKNGDVVEIFKKMLGDLTNV